MLVEAALFEKLAGGDVAHGSIGPHPLHPQGLSGELAEVVLHRKGEALTLCSRVHSKRIEPTRLALIVEGQDLSFELGLG